MALKQIINFLESDLEREYHNLELFHQCEDRISDPKVLSELGRIMRDTLKHIVMLGEQIIALREVTENLPMSEMKTMNLKPALSDDELCDAIVEFLKEEETMKVMYKEQAEQVPDDKLKTVLLAIHKDEVEHVRIVNSIITRIERRI
jgi:rubrerythrin